MTRPIGGAGSGVRFNLIYILELGLGLEIMRSNIGDEGGEDELWFRINSVD